MKVQISAIGPEGLKISDTIPLKSLNDRMQEGRVNDIVFVQAPKVELLITRTPGGAQSCGRICSRYCQPCSLCLDPVERDIEAEINYVLQAVNRTPSEAGQAFSPPCDDIGIVYFEGDQINLEDTLQESLILGLSPFWHPPLDSQGNCSLCKKEVYKPDRNSATGTLKLGELLKKAGIA